MEKELTLEEKWERATLANNFIFYKVMRHHPEECKHLIELLLGIEIEKIVMANEETIIFDHNAKSIRLDVYAKNSTQVFDVEIQTTDTGDLPERARYYQGMMDLDSLQAGEEYNKLKTSHVIFLCMKDIFKNGLPVCTFENICLEDMKTKLGDRTQKHFFFVPSCAKMIENKKARDFFNFLMTNKSADGFTDRLKNFVENAKHNSQWRFQYMTWERQQAYARKEGYMEGIAEGSRENALSNAKNLLALGVSTETVAKGCSLPLEQVLALKEELDELKVETGKLKAEK